MERPRSSVGIRAQHFEQKIKSAPKETLDVEPS